MGAVVLQEGSIVPGSSFTSPINLNGISTSWLDHGGSWYGRGSNVNGTDWIVRNSVVVANSAGLEEVVPGSGEHWGDALFTACFFAHDGPAASECLIGEVTDNPDPLRDGVLVLDCGSGFRRVLVPRAIRSTSTATVCSTTTGAASSTCRVPASK